MLNIPSAIKALFQTDGVRKNFRVHFPNGEYPDITNDNVVSESVKFTESLCSQSVFKFGLAEASVLEFETVGIGNMFGMTIEASIEIDVSSLSQADIEAIEAGTWDGELIADYGANIWDEQWVSYGTYFLPANFIPVTPLTTYYVAAPMNISVQEYNQSQVYKRNHNISNTTFETGADCYFLKFRPPDAYGGTYNHDIAINYPPTVEKYTPHILGGWFRIRYGVFRVDKCPRNHGAMAHRQVTAYTQTLVKNLPTVERLKLQVGSLDSAEYTPTIQNLFYSIVNDETALLNNGYTKEQITPTFVDKANSSFYIQYVPVTEDQPDKITVSSLTGNYYGIEVVCGFTNRHCVPANDSITWRYGTPKNALFSLEIGENYPKWLDHIADFVSESLLIDYDKLAEWGYSTLKDYLRDKLTRVESPAPAMIFAPAVSPSLTDQPLNPQKILIENDIPVFYPYLNTSQLMTISLPKTVNITENGAVGVVVDSTSIDYTALYGNEFKLYEYRTSAAEMFSSFATTGQRIYNLNGVDYKINTFIDSYNPINIAQGLLELIARFYKDNRLGGGEVIQLTKVSPVLLTADNYSECWWDEYDVDPIGVVTVTYKNTDNNDTTENIVIGTGASLYDMSSNEAIKNLVSQSLANITALITSNFAPYVGAVTFTPIELTMQGLPWIEAGDALQIEAEDGVIVESYALRIEMSGIQHLQAVITAEGGEIIGETD